MRNLFLGGLLLVFMSCKDTILPKPKAYLSLQFPQSNYQPLKIPRPYVFEINTNTILENETNEWLKINYPTLKASVDITYRKINNNLSEVLVEAEKLVFKHTIKAEQIIPKDYVNYKKRVFGTIYDITGNAASNFQFHLTDSTKHFIKGSLFFYAKPNYDSIVPAIAHVKKDMIRLIETLEWEN